MLIHPIPICLAVILPVSMMCAPARAHHSYAQYDRCSNVSIEGEIQHITWSNPHVVIILKTEKSVDYRIEWFNVQRLARYGIGQETLQAGDRVIITGSENRDPEEKIVTLLTGLNRTSDDWFWSRPFPVNPPAPCTD